MSVWPVWKVLEVARDQHVNRTSSSTVPLSMIAFSRTKLYMVRNQQITQISGVDLFVGRSASFRSASEIFREIP